ncbi:NAD(P)-dependent oxidoreductase [Trueperella pyogenes]|uniref:NAD(P)-dependent oxidoreductase n=1 Tax=Trueperella pyogenes TaxID=1661 RepID=UPI000E0D33DA|nr:NAD(P)-dependent oxidoreductase [Trueperella pyogenes]MCI7690619.1 NAD(P)-dependent oxidoreductase [Trueperella pyogenes]
MNIAVLGLGAMGLPIATWLNNKFCVVGYDVAETRLALARKAGLICRPTSHEAVHDANIVLIAVRNQEQFDTLLYGDTGIVSAMKPDAIIILTSTIGMEATAQIAQKLAADNIRLVDAPVSGGPLRAGKGDLLVTVGADENTYAEAEPVLNAMASTLIWVGKTPGKGQAMKTVNQLLCGIHIAAAGEALALAGELGLDLDVTLEALTSGAAASFMLGDRGPRAIQASRGETPEVKSRLDIFVKDMGIVTNAAKSVGMAVPVAAAAEQLYLQGLARNRGADDDSTVITLITPEQV